MKKIPADVFDFLEMSALAYGGIGGGAFQLNDQPYCLAGHMSAGCDEGVEEYREVRESVRADGFHDSVVIGNDSAVCAINARKSRDYRARVSWEEYIAERGWVRDDAEAAA